MVIKTIYFSIVLLVILISIGDPNINYAQVLNPRTVECDVPEAEVAYTFTIPKKLNGNGGLKLSVEKNKIKGIATGIGRACQCNVDFQTNIEGALNNPKGKITVDVVGIGDPEGIVPGKVNFQGPLKGSLTNGKLSLIGKVNISGSLAKYGGFKEKEDLIIEINDSKLIQALKHIQNRGSLASL